MDAATLHAYHTVALLVVFIGIWAWAWSHKRKSDFDEASRLPLEDDLPGNLRPDNRKEG